MKSRTQCQFALLFICFSSVLCADEQLDELFELSPAELAEISVTIASGTKKPVFRSAAVTSVITAQQISTMGATDLHEVLETIPGLHVSIQAITGDHIYSMRGIRNDFNSQVLFMLNGSRFNIPYKGSPLTGMEMPVEAIARIEVIRGPGSAVYGADAFAGVINIITKKAQDIDGTTVGIRGGSWDTQSIWGQHGSQWLGWNVSASLQYAHNNDDEDRIIKADAQTAFDQAFSTSVSNAPGVMRTQNERWNAHLNLQRKYLDINFWAYNETDADLRAGAGGALDNNGQLNGNNFLGDIHFSTEDLLGDDWQLLAQASFISTNIHTKIYNFPAGSILPIGADGNLNPYNPTGLVSFPDGMRTNLRIKTKAPTIKLTTIYKGFENHIFRLIGSFRHELVNTEESRNYGVGIINGNNLVPPPTINLAAGMQSVTGTDLIFLPDKHRSIWSIAFQDEWLITPELQLTAGLRYDEYSDFGGTINPRVALVWDINEKLSSKLLYGQAFRAPSFLELYQQNSQLFIGNPDLEPEKIQTIELAFDYRPTETLRSALNIFYYQIDDPIGEELVSTNTSLQVRNQKGQYGYGTEFEWDWRFLPKWNFRGNYAWQYSRNQATHRRVSNVPENQVYGALSWQFLSHWQIQTQVNWIGHRVSGRGDPRVLDDYETVDITLNGKKLFDFLDLSASVRNLFDSNGKEPAIAAYSNSMPIAGQSFYFEAAVHF